MILTDTGIDTLLWLTRAVLWLSITVVVVGTVALISALLAWVFGTVRAWLPTQIDEALWADEPEAVPEALDEQVGNEAAWMPLDAQAREQWETWIREEDRRE